MAGGAKQIAVNHILKYCNLTETINICNAWRDTAEVDIITLLLRRRLPLLALFVCVALHGALPWPTLPGACAERSDRTPRHRTLQSSEDRSDAAAANSGTAFAAGARQMEKRAVGTVRLHRSLLQKPDDEGDIFPFQDVCSRTCQESPWRIVGVSRSMKGRAIIVYCLKLQNRGNCTASPCCSSLGMGVDALTISMAATGKCNVTSIARVTAGGDTLSRYDNYPMQYTYGDAVDVGLMVTDLASLGRPVEGLEVCYEARPTCTQWSDICRSGVPGSSSGCRFSVTPQSPRFPRIPSAPGFPPQVPLAPEPPSFPDSPLRPPLSPKAPKRPKPATRTSPSSSKTAGYH
ncbi:hypothetical protein VOLCADRAFT_87907 [Volvox carteri f. nagariensis]|uniref:Pherophorin domain-containing protein n=1 Tax=Volvox carteri f. nagariensis TaxID=3068 RepID=D8TMJ8_VOLCA|nr:uncharacterized protein VOLCADRAFT_87907 [Volvox carteri f. nagariensis]EFJ51268.1 hypothetical protein VOLCADRAFT_87907 [Volvox carteri f. nagariensis]|eukprot:XP_002947735.1 hypothetical protein VOLCADRAFT_87907 [Volvox carteri f. nagariensis]